MLDDRSNVVVVQIIENEKDARGFEHIRFRPYRSPRNPDLILANWQYAGQPVAPKGPAPIDGHQLGTPVHIEFCRAVTTAHENGVPFVWVDDPDGLFPTADRPAFEIAQPCGINDTFRS
jgi:hypothetical protein